MNDINIKVPHEYFGKCLHIWPELNFGGFIIYILERLCKDL